MKASVGQEEGWKDVGCFFTNTFDGLGALATLMMLTLPYTGHNCCTDALNSSCVMVLRAAWEADCLNAR